MRYTPQAKKALDYAKRISKKLEHNYVGTEHLLVALLHDDTSLAAKILANENIKDVDIIQLIKDLIAPDTVTPVMERDGYTPKLNTVLEQAEKEASICHMDEIGTEHLLMAILRIQDSAGARLLNSMDINPQKLFNNIVAAMGKWRGLS